jgi:hypothetical protein
VIFIQVGVVFAAVVGDIVFVNLGVVINQSKSS